MHYYKHT